MGILSRTCPPALPHELWRQVISDMSFTEQRACLAVCRLFREFSLPFIFSHVTVRLGKCRHGPDPSEDWTDEESAEAIIATERSRELLEHIVKSPEFAKLVKKITVLAYMPSSSAHPEDTIHALVETLEVLRLHEFSWYGCGPEPQTEVLYALAEKSNSSLSKLILPPQIPALCMALSLIENLQSLSFVPRYYYGDSSDDYSGTDHNDKMALAAEVNRRSLRYLCIPGEVFAVCSTWTFSALVDLALLSPIDSVGLHSVFEDLTQLQSLTICIDHDSNGDTMADTFEEHVDALPHLKAFKLLAVWMTAEDMNAIAAFLERKAASLERLDIVNQTRGGPELESEPLLRILADFPRLTVFGCDVRTRRLTADHLARLSACIPQRVTALALNIAIDFEWDATEDDWARFFETQRTCCYLHIITDCQRVSLDLQKIAARHAPEALELLGYNNTLRWMSHGGDAASDGDASMWPPSRVYFRTVEDFDGHEEWEWLLRHHGQDAPLPIPTPLGFGAPE